MSTHQDPDHHKPDYNRAFAAGVALNIAFVIAEAVFGVISGSLALLADAGHNLSDVLGLLLAWGASYLSQRKPSGKHTYGWRSSSILAALLNAVILLVAVGGIAWEAVRRFNHPAPVAEGTIIWVAMLGVVINTATALFFHSGRKGDLNIRGAFLHMAADAAVSAGVVAAGLLIRYTGWQVLDPIMSLVIAGVILVGTWGLLRESLDLALHAVPEGVDMRAVEAYLTGLPGVTGIHDLHIWGMSTTEHALTAHLTHPEGSQDDALTRQARLDLHDRFGIEHVTLQWERDPEACGCLSPCNNGCD